MENGDRIDYNRLHWESDWNGYEVGHNDVCHVGLYRIPNFPIWVYIDTEKGRIIETWHMYDDEE